MKSLLRWSCLLAATSIAAATISAPAAAQLPPELLGGGGPQGPNHSEAFYKSVEGFWVLMRKPENDGLRCSVNWIQGDGTVFALHGPWDARMAAANQGMFWFSGPNVPRAPRTPAQVQITVQSKDPTGTYPAIHMDAGGMNSFVLVGDVRKQMRTDKKQDDDITIIYNGKTAFHTKVIRLQEAYRKLESCMSAGTTSGRK